MNAANNKPTKPNNAQKPVSARTMKSPGRASTSAMQAPSYNNSGGGGATTKVIKPKLPEKKSAIPQRTSSQVVSQPRRSTNAANGNNYSTSTSKGSLQAKCEQQEPKKKPSSTAASSSRVWNRNPVKKDTSKPVERAPKPLEPITTADECIQTNEREILNVEHIVGDIKFMLPSRSLVNQIEHNRLEEKKLTMLKTKRKFEEHSLKQEEHLTDLKEFLEKSFITRRGRKPHEALEMDRKLINSMDQIMKKEIPKAESITEIKGRIKKKEQELLSLFDNIVPEQMSNDLDKSS